jgi:hypothetical protein
MLCPDPFRRAAVLALAWCLVGLGFDPGPVGAPPTQANGPCAAWVPGRFATAQTSQPTPSYQTKPARTPQ